MPIGRLYTEHPFLDIRRMTASLCAEGQVVNHKRVHRLMQSMQIQAIISARAAQHEVCTTG